MGDESEKKNQNHLLSFFPKASQLFFFIFLDPSFKTKSDDLFYLNFKPRVMLCMTLYRCQQKLDFDHKHWLQLTSNGSVPVTTGLFKMGRMTTGI